MNGQFYYWLKSIGRTKCNNNDEYWASLLSFITLAALYVGVAVVVSFFTSHYLLMENSYGWMVS